MGRFLAVFLPTFPYRMNPMEQQYLREEIQYLLDHDFIEPSQSDWSSPCILVPNMFYKRVILWKKDYTKELKTVKCTSFLGQTKPGGIFRM